MGESCLVSLPRLEEESQDIIGRILNKIPQLAASSEALQKIKFGSGAVSKLVWLGCVAFVSIAFLGKNLSATGGLIALVGIFILAIAIVAAVLLMVFKRPEAAAMEGMELVYYAGLQLGAKGISPNRTALPIPDPTPPPADKNAGKE
jgi:hypothetical protein